ncbi:ABC transporter permease [Streptomyces vinaceus]|uniref:ABC transporter permease n=1 Tax=Streptomyces vinaceus TaxID=1960 RepID=UPI0036A7DF73
MTTTRTHARSGSAPAQRRLPPHGLLWLVLRQQRLALAVFAIAAIGITLYAAQGRAATLDAITQLNLPPCPPTENCPVPQAFRRDHVQPLRGLLSLLPLLPMALGLFLGGPVFSQEQESGTHRMVLSQSVTRGRWFLAKVSVPVLFAAAVSAAVTKAATDWWSLAAGRMGADFGWMSWMPYDAIGPAPVARAVLMVSVGIACGVLLRRTVTAMGAAALAIGILLVALEESRRFFRPMITTEGPFGQLLQSPGGAWEYDRGLTTASGAPATVPPQCSPLDTTEKYLDCARDHGVARQWVTYHPHTDLWPIQYTETAICLAAAAAVLVLAWWWTRKRLH